MRRYFTQVLIFALAAVACYEYWQWRGRLTDLPDLPGARFQCLSYSPFEGNSGPLDRDFDVPREVIARDLKLVNRVTGCIRTYSALKVQGDVTRIAHEQGLKVLQGIWISGTAEDNEKEIAAATELVRAYPDTVTALFVGNEVLLRREMTGEALARIIRQVKTATGKTVLYADVPHFFKKEPVVVAAADVLAIHILPYWDDPEAVSIDEVQGHVAGIVADVRRTYPGKALMIGEIGWPSAGRTRGGAVPSLVNQARFVREFVRGAERLGIDYNLIEAIDQPWKRIPEGTVGGYWGIFSADRVLKFPLTGPVSEWPRWRIALSASLAIMTGFFVLAFARLRFKRLTHWAAYGTLAPATAISLVHLYDFVRLTSLTLGGWLFGLYMAALTGAAALGLAAKLGGRVSAGSDPLPALFGRPIDPRRWPTPRLIGAAFWLAALPVAVLALAIGFNGRHRDLPIMGLWLPGLALMVLAHRKTQESRPRREEAWLAALLFVSAILALDGWRNVEMMLWSATVLLFAAPGWRDIVAEIRFLLSGTVEGRRAQKSDDHGHGR